MGHWKDCARSDQPFLDPLGEFALRMRARAVSVNCRAHTETWRSEWRRLGKDEQISLNHSLAMLGSWKKFGKMTHSMNDKEVNRTSVNKACFSIWILSLVTSPWLAGYHPIGPSVHRSPSWGTSKSRLSSVTLPTTTAILPSCAEFSCDTAPIWRYCFYESMKHCEASVSEFTR